jgi:TonB family protein
MTALHQNMTIVAALAIVSCSTVALAHPHPEGGRVVEPARARANLPALISDSDYPSEARAAGIEGSVRARLTVDTSGRVAACEISESSGHAILDATTCRVLQSRARFTPARDNLGQPIASVIEAPAIRWRAAVSVSSATDRAGAEGRDVAVAERERATNSALLQALVERRAAIMSSSAPSEDRRAELELIDRHIAMVRDRLGN